jgi:drug/metabolite transporter (DMT)-like permease
MVAVAFALLAALLFGLSDFVGGLLSKTRSVWMVATASRVTAASGSAALALVAPGDPRISDFGWAAAAGIGGAVGISFLYRGLSRGRMGVVAPISATGAALVPVVVGVVTGDDPSLLAWVGIVAAFPAIYFVTQVDNDAPAEGESVQVWSGASDGVLAGLGFGALYALVGQFNGDAGFLPLALLHLVAAAIIVVSAAAMRQSWIPRGPGLLPVFTFGLLGAAALVSFLFATEQGLLTIVSVIAALYPASTILMAAVVLREKIGRRQSVGLGMATIAIVLVTIG